LTNAYLVLAQRIRSEVVDLDRTVQRVTFAWIRFGEVSQDREIYVDSLSLNLQSFYTGIERILERIARIVDRSVPSSHNWHEELLLQMSREIAEQRPAVFSAELVEKLDDLRRFRHLVRNIYAHTILPDRLEHVVHTTQTVWPQLSLEIVAFADFLELLAASIQSDD
jgi:hypothetical protein